MKNLDAFKSFTNPKLTLADKSNAVIYTRVSSAGQEENTSLASQKKFCEHFATQRGLNIVSYFGGKVESAKSDERKEFSKMLTYIKRNKSISHIIVYSYERFSRTGVNGAKIADDLLKDYGIVTLAVTQEIDPSTPSGSFQQKIFFLFSEFDNQLRRDKTITGMKELLLKGFWTWQVPLGYKDLNAGRAVDRKIVVDPKYKNLKKAFEWKARGVPKSEICKRLEKYNIKLDQRRIHEILANPFYCGIIVNDMIPGEVIEGQHEALVSKKLFLDANNLKSSINHPKTHQMVSEDLPLKVFMKCTSCGNPMTGFHVKKKDLFYYKCRTNGCSNLLNTKKAHSQFKNLLSKYEVNGVKLEILKDQVRDEFLKIIKEKVTDKKALQMSIKEIKKKVESIEERFVTGEIDKSLYEKFKLKYEAELTQKRELLDGEKIKSSNLEKCIEFTTNLSSKLHNTWELGNSLEKMKFQNMVFPSGISLDPENKRVQTPRINSFFSLINSLSEFSKNKKSGKLTRNRQKSAFVTSEGFKPSTSTAVMWCTIQLCYEANNWLQRYSFVFI